MNYLLFIVVVYLTYLTLRSIFLYYIQIKYKVYIGHLSFTKISNIKLESFELKKLSYRFRNWSFIITVDDLLITLPLKKRSEEPVELKEKSLSSLKGRISALLASKFFRILLTTIRLQFTNVNIRSEEFLFHLSKFQLQVNLPASIVHNQNMSFSIHSTIAPFELFYINNLSNLKMCLLYSNLESSFALYHTSAILFGEIIKPDIELKLKGFNFSINNIIKISKMNKYNQATPPPYAKTIISLTESATEDVKVIITEKICNIIDNITPVLNEVALVQPNFIFLINDTKFQLRGDHNSDNLDFDSGFGKFNVLNNLITEEKSPTITMSLKNFSISLLVSNDAEKLIKLPLSQNLTWHQNKPLIEMQLTIASLNITINNIPNTFKSSEVLALPSLNIKFNSQLLPNPSLSFANRMKSSLGIQVEIEEPSFILEDSALKVLHLFQIKKEKRSDATPTNQNSSSLTDARIVAFEVIFNIFISLSVSIVVINPKIRNRYVITQSNESDIVFGFGECKILLWSGCEGNLETTTNSPLLNLQLSCKYIFLVFEKIIEGREKALDKLIAEPEWTFIANCGIELLNDDEEFDRNLSKQNFVPVNDYQKKYIYKTFIVNLSVELGSIFLNLIKISDSENVSEYHLIIQKIGELLNDMKFTKGVKVEETVTPILNVQKTSNFIPFLVNLNFNLKVEGKKLMVAVSGEDTRNSVIFCCEKYDWRQSVTLVNKVAQLKIHSSSQNPHIDMEPVERSYVRKNKTPTVPLICTVTSPEDNKTTFEDEIVDGNLSAYFSSFRRRPSISPDAKQVISDNFDLIKNFGANEKEDHKSSSKSSVGKPSAVVKPLKSVPLIKKFKKYQSNEQFRELVESENPFFKVARKSHKNSSSGTELSMPFESNNVTYIEELKIVEFQQLFTSGDAYACDISIKVVILCENCNLEASADNFSSYVEPLIQIKSLVVKIPLICHGNAPELSEHLSFSNKPLISPITEVKFHDVRFTFSIPTAYVLLLSVLWVKKLNKILNYVPEVKKKRVTLKNQEIVKFFIDNFDVQLHLQEVELRLEMKIIQMSFGDWWNQNLRCIVLLSASLDELKAFVPKSFKKFTLNKTDNEFVSADEVEDEYVWDEILFIQYLTIDLQKREFAKKLLLALNDKNSRTTNFNKNLEVKSQLLSPDSLKPADSPRKNETPFASADFKNCSSASNVETNACKFTTNNLKLDPEQMQNYVVLKFGSVVLRIPPLFELSDIIDSLIATNKSLKYLLNTLLDVPLSKMPNTGFTRIDVKTIPEILVDVGTFSLVLDDDPFETWLSRNFKLGLEEQSDRISRDRAFQRKVHILRNHRKHKVSPVDIGDDSDDSTNNLYTNESTEANIEKAWWQLQNFNADSWIKKLRGSPFHPPPLLKVNCVDLNFKFTAPELLTETIEETLHLMDPLQTPAKKVYDELIPRNIDVGFDSFLALLRDYSFPLVDLPSSAELFPNHKTWRTTGLVIIAEQFADDASKRWITVPVVPLPYDSIIFYRTINPVKLYLSLKTKIKVGSAKSLKLIWGASVDPAITDVTRVLDSFTKPNPDPSPLGGWWDKLRVMVHGNYQVDMGGGGDIRLQILSSFSPYRKKLSGLNLSSALSVVDGVEFVLAKGARIIFGTQEKHFKNNNVDNDTIVVETGVLIMTAPTSSGNDIDIEEGETECNTWSELVIAKLVGGVRVGFGIDFMIKVYSEDGEEEDEIFPTKTHCDIVLMTPQYVERLKKIAKRKSKFGLNFDSEMDYDAFLGFRANSMKIVVNILSPHPFYSSLTNPINSLCLDPASIDRVRLISNLYQSPLSNLPVHRGPLFMAGPIPTKPKLLRSIGSFHLKVTMLPLVLGLINEMEGEIQSGVGLRCRAEKMDIDMFFVQKLIKNSLQEVNLDSSLSSQPRIKHTATSWSLKESEIGFTELEGRTISFGNAYNMLLGGIANEAAVYGTAENSAVDDKDHDEDWAEWILDEDFQYMEDTSKLRMIPFIWSPKISYFKRTEKEDSSMIEDKVRSQGYLYGVQISLFKMRLKEIEASIRHYMEIQQGLEYRIGILFDDTLRQQSSIIVEKLAFLYEKKAAIRRYIKSCSVDKNAEKEPPMVTLQRSTPSKSSPNISCFPEANGKALFDHYYIIHNINLLWKKEVRNTLFKLFDLQSKSLAVKYFMTNDSNRLVKELISTVSQKGVGQEGNLYDGEYAKNEFSPQKLATNSKVGFFDQDMAVKLLQQLIKDRDSNFGEIEVQNETNSGTETINFGTTLKRKSENFLASQFTYFSSKDPDSPDYIPPGYYADSNNIILLVNPQINFEAEFGEHKQLQTMVVAAENMELLSISIVDSSYKSDYVEDSTEMVAKTRKILNIHNAQFFVARSVDIEEAEDSDLDNIIMRSTLDLTFEASKSEITWPVWVPIECLVDHNSHIGFLQRVMERTSATAHRDTPNTLYVKRSRSNCDTKSNFVHADVFHINFPTFIISVTSMQYEIVYNIITNLLVYRDPMRGQRNDRRRKMILGLEQMSDLQKVMGTVINLQDKIRHAETLLKYRLGHKKHVSKVSEVRQVLITYMDELYVLMEALKEMLSLSRKKESVDVAWMLNVTAGKLIWIMKLDSGDPLCQWNFDVCTFNYIQNEDQSSSNTLEIDKLYIENKLDPPSGFKDLLSPFLADKRALDFNKHKLLRIYWSELAPVAGIPVVEHFEVVIFPISLNVTLDIGRELVYYVFPEKKAKALAESHELPFPASEKSYPSTYAPSLTASVQPSQNFYGNNELKNYEGALKPPKKKKAALSELEILQSRASENKSFIYIKMPEFQLCLSYKGSKEKNVEDLNRFVFKMPTLEYRNRTWSWLDFYDEVKKDGIRAIFDNTGSLIKEKLFTKKTAVAENLSNSTPFLTPLPSSLTTSIVGIIPSPIMKTSKSMDLPRSYSDLSAISVHSDNKSVYSAISAGDNKSVSNNSYQHSDTLVSPSASTNLEKRKGKFSFFKRKDKANSTEMLLAEDATVEADSSQSNSKTSMGRSGSFFLSKGGSTSALSENGSVKEESPRNTFFNLRRKSEKKI